MAEAIIIVIFVVAFFLMMRLLLYLIRHPDIDFHLDGKVLAHEPGLEDGANKVMAYLHEEEKAYLDEINVLVGSEEFAARLLAYLEKHDLIEVYEEAGEVYVSYRSDE